MLQFVGRGWWEKIAMIFIWDVTTENIIVMLENEYMYQSSI
jgi:hypothetical protein